MIVNRACCPCVDACRRMVGETGGGHTSRRNEAGSSDHGAGQGKSRASASGRCDVSGRFGRRGRSGGPAVRGRTTRHWIEGGEVRCLEVTEDEPLPALLEAVSGGVRASRRAFPILTKWSGRSATALLAALKLFLEQLDGMLPTPECEGCGKPMRRHPATRKSFLTRFCRVEVESTYFRCRSCGKGRFPLNRAPGVEGSAISPGLASALAETVPLMSFDAASRHIANLAGVDAYSRPLKW